MKELNRTLMILLTCLIAFLQVSIVHAQYDWISYGNGFTPLWQQQYTGSYGRFDAEIINVTSIEGYSPIGKGSVQPLISSMSSNNTPYGEQEYVIFPNGNYLQIYDKNLFLIDEINVGGSIVNQFDITDFDRNGLVNDVVGIWNISGNYKFRAYTYNFSSQSYFLYNETNIYSNSSDVIMGLRCSGGNCRYIKMFYDEEVWKGNFTIINKTTFYQVPLILNGQIFNVSNAGDYTEPLGWFDFDRDENLEYIGWTDQFIIMFESNGTIEFNKIINGILDVKPFNSQAIGTCSWWQYLTGQCNQNTFWRIAIIINGEITSYKLDGSVLWGRGLSTGFFSGTFPACPTGDSYDLSISGKIAIDDDYDKDYSKYDNELFIIQSGTLEENACHLAVSTTQYYILKGYDGSIIYSSIYNFYLSEFLTIADMNNNGYKDFIISRAEGEEGLIIKDVYSGFFYSINGTVLVNCIPADVNLDGFLEIICSGEDGSIILSSALVNQNAYITSVVYNPSTIVKVNNSLIITINAIDPENNPLLYGIKCNNTANWSDDQSSPIFSCYYGELGTFTNTVRVRDQYHFGIYDTFSQQIQVTEAGAVCNFNNVCEGNLGENNINCPADCPCNFNNVCESNLGETYTSCPNDCPYAPSPPIEWQEIDLPTKIVDVENIEQGLLPTIYYGTLSFLSSTLSPMIILIFVIFFVLIILTIGTIIKKIAHKI